MVDQSDYFIHLNGSRIGGIGTVGMKRLRDILITTEDGKHLMITGDNMVISGDL